MVSKEHRGGGSSKIMNSGLADSRNLQGRFEVSIAKVAVIENLPLRCNKKRTVCN